MEILCYRGNLPNPQWLDDDSCKFLPTSRVLVLKRYFLAFFANLCTIRANLSKAANNSVSKIGLSGEVYYQVDFDVVAFFGSTELTAQMAWKENVSHEPHRFSFSLIATGFLGD